MPTSLIPDKKEKRSSGQILKTVKNSLREFVSAFVLFGIVVAVYIGVTIWASFLNNELEDIKLEKRAIVESVSAQGDIMEYREFALFIHDLQQILENQNTPSEFFEFFDDSIHKNVTIRSFSFSMGDASLEVAGSVPAFEELGQQMLIWTTETQFIESVELDSFGKSDKGNVDFQVIIDVNEDYI